MRSKDVDVVWAIVRHLCHRHTAMHSTLRQSSPVRPEVGPGRSPEHTCPKSMSDSDTIEVARVCCGAAVRVRSDTGGGGGSCAADNGLCRPDTGDIESTDCARDRGSESCDGDSTACHTDCGNDSCDGERGVWGSGSDCTGAEVECGRCIGERGDWGDSADIEERASGDFGCVNCGDFIGDGGCAGDSGVAGNCASGAGGGRGCEGDNGDAASDACARGILGENAGEDSHGDSGDDGCIGDDRSGVDGRGGDRGRRRM